MSYLECAYRVIGGAYGVGQERKDKLRAQGYDPTIVQEIVNDLLDSELSFDPTAAYKSERTLEVEIDLRKYDSLMLNFKGV